MNASQARPSTLLWLYAVTIFLSAFLLFQVQPMIGKYILPWFGSTPGVWATALLFFQLMLLGGYAYAHFVVSRLSWKRQAIVHVILLSLALISLPITPAEALKPIDPDAPVARILLILMLSVGAPFFLLSTTAPLLQRWYALLHPDRSPYRLYALSNFGSLLALLSYPFLIERLIPLQTQTWIWSGGYVVFAGLCAGCGWQLARYSSGAERDPKSSADQPAGVVAQGDEVERPGAGAAVLWLSLAACGSGLLMATTNQMSIDIAIVPFLWIVPLSLYLLTFILCFDSERWYIRPLFSALLPLALINTLRLLYVGSDLGIVDQMVGYSLTLFICCMCCHGELARLRPAPRQLTFFFLMVSAGGALGGIFVAILAPAIFTGFFEFHILLVACYGLVVLVQLPRLFRPGSRDETSRRNRVLAGLCWAVLLITIVIGAFFSVRPGTWFSANPTANLAEAFSNWQDSMLQAALYATAALLLFLEIWRRWQGTALRVWWRSSRGVARCGVSTLLAVGLLSLAGSLTWQVRDTERRMVEQNRNFYGVLAIKERGVGESGLRLSLTHGRIRHGDQHQKYPTWPTTYFGPETGVGVALRHHPARSDPTRQFRFGVVGLGVGTLAAYANTHIDVERPESSYVVTREGGVPDFTRFYELNPLVVNWATERFTFLEDASSRGADVDVFQGDARIVLERQLRAGEGQQFDVLAIDAFSSDAIPIHLLTLESFQTYLGHLSVDGILALHVTNRYVDLIPIVARLAEAVEMEAIYIVNYAHGIRFVESTDWILLTRNQAFLDNEAVHEDEEPLPAPGQLWTDDFSSLFEVITTGL
jgi:hypothetical protein|tara:strand:- start:418 stop:2877 length:2460 start_codon:yes stop_codon:yes gene_type:complete